MATRNLVPRSQSQGKLGIAGKEWQAVHADTLVATTLEVSSLVLKGDSDSSLFVAGAGIATISKVNNQYSFAIDNTLLTSALGFNADGTKSNFELPDGNALPANTIIAADDSLVEAIQKLNNELRDVADPSNLTVDSFAAGSKVLSAEGLSENTTADNKFVSAKAIVEYISGLGIGGDITSVSAGTGLELEAGNGTSGDVTIAIADTAVTAGSYGSATAIPTFTVDQQGRLTTASSVGITTVLTIDADGAGSQNVSLSTDDLQILGGTGLTSSISKPDVDGNPGTDVIVSIALDDTAVTAGSYGSATQIPTFTVDQQGRLTAAGTAAISTTLNILSDDGGNVNPVALADDTLSLLGGTGITSTNTGDAVTFNLDNTAVTAAQYGDADSVAQFTVDAQGRLTQAANVDISISSSQVSDATNANTAEKIVRRDASGDFAAGTITATLVGNASTASKWANAQTITLGGDLSGSVDIDGSAAVTLTATIAENSVALGTDTTGNYVQSLTAGAGITTFPAASESADLTISVDGVLAQLDSLTPLADGDDDGKFIVATADNTFAYESGDTVKTSLGLGTGDSPEFSGLTLNDQGSLILKELNVNGNHNISIKSPATLDASYTLILPENDGLENYVLKTDGSGVLSWSAVTGAAGSTNSFAVVAVDGQNNLEADSASDTLTFEAGSGIALTTTAGTDTLTIAASNIDNNDISAAAGIVDTKLATISSANKVALTALDIDGGIDIQADLADDDLIIVDYGGDGTNNRKSAMSRVATYINDHSSITTLSSLSSVGAQNNTLTAAGNLTVTGDLVVNGDSLTVNTATLNVEDPLISLASGNNASDSIDIGFYGLYDTTGAQDLYAGLFRDASDGKFKLFKDLQDVPTTTVDITGTGYSGATLVASLEGNVTGNVTGQVSDVSNHDTGDITEGANLYFTDARARGAVSVTDAGGDGSLAYNSGTGVITYTGPSAAETRAHFSGGTGVTIANGSIAIGQAVTTTSDVTFNSVTANITGNVTGQVSDVSNHDTDDIDEGEVNLYYTDTRSRGSISVTDSGGDGSLGYNNTTGVITYTGPSAAETRAHFSGGTGVTITDGAIAIGQAVAKTDNVQFAGFKFADGDTLVTGIETSIDGDSSNALFPTALAVKSYVDNEITNHCLFVIGDDYDSEDAATVLNVDLSGDEKLEIIGSEGITTSVSSGANDTKDTITVSISQNGIDLDRITSLTSMTVIGNVTGAAASPAEVSIKDEDDMTSNSATALVTQQSVKAFVEAKLGRHGGMFKTSLRVDGNGDPIQEGGNNIYDVVFSAAPIIRSHFGPFAFSLNDLHTSGGSDIIFYGSDSYQSSDRHFEVLIRKDSNGNVIQENGSNIYDTSFTGANSTTP